MVWRFSHESFVHANRLWWSWMRCCSMVCVPLTLLPCLPLRPRCQMSDASCLVGGGEVAHRLICVSVWYVCVCTYKHTQCLQGQVKLVQATLARAAASGTAAGACAEVETDSVDRFQGRDKECVLLSFVSHHQGGEVLCERVSVCVFTQQLESYPVGNIPNSAQVRGHCLTKL